MSRPVSASVRRRLARVAERQGTIARVPQRPDATSPELPECYHEVARKFVRWMDARGRALPAKSADVVAYIDTWPDLAFNSARFRRAGIGALHRCLGLADPTASPAVRARMRAFRLAVPPGPRTPRRGGPGRPGQPIAPNDPVTRIPDLGEPARLTATAQAAARVSSAALAPRTITNYRTSFTVFVRFCADAGVSSLPADGDTVRRFLTARDDATFNAMSNYANAISWTHRVAGHADPTRDPAVVDLLAVAKRARPARKAERISPADVRAILAPLGDEPLDRRDRAFVLLVLGGSLKHEQVVALDRSRVAFERDGVLLHLGPDEAIFVGAGAHPETDPVRAVRRWLDVVGTEPGPLFPALGIRGGFASETLSAKGGRRIVKRLADRAGLDSRRFTVIGIRRGALHAAAAAGLPASALMAHARLSLNSVLNHTGTVGEPFALAAVTRRARRAKGATRS